MAKINITGIKDSLESKKKTKRVFDAELHMERKLCCMAFGDEFGKSQGGPFNYLDERYITVKSKPKKIRSDRSIIWDCYLRVKKFSKLEYPESLLTWGKYLKYVFGIASNTKTLYDLGKTQRDVFRFVLSDKMIDSFTHLHNKKERDAGKITKLDERRAAHAKFFDEG